VDRDANPFERPTVSPICLASIRPRGSVSDAVYDYGQPYTCNGCSERLADGPRFRPRHRAVTGDRDASSTCDHEKRGHGTRRERRGCPRGIGVRGSIDDITTSPVALTVSRGPRRRRTPTTQEWENFSLNVNTEVGGREPVQSGWRSDTNRSRSACVACPGASRRQRNGESGVQPETRDRID
jgi:hypothetical protein